MSHRQNGQTLSDRKGRRIIDGARQRLSLEPSVLEFLENGAPAAEIVKTAKEWPADIVVMGGHGRAGMERVLLGSVAETVVRQAPCPVLIVRVQG